MQNWIRREIKITGELEACVDSLFGERFFEEFMTSVQEATVIEANEYLGIVPPSNNDLAAQIGYFRELRRLQRFRSEYSLRNLLEVTILLATKEAGEIPATEDLMYAAQRLKESLVFNDKFKIRKSLEDRYYGEKIKEN